MCASLRAELSALKNHLPCRTEASTEPENPEEIRRWGDANWAANWRCASRSWGQQAGCWARRARPCPCRCPSPAGSSGDSRHARCSGRCHRGGFRSARWRAHGTRRAGSRCWGQRRRLGAHALCALLRSSNWRRSRWSSPHPRTDSIGVPTSRSTTMSKNAWGTF